MLTRTVEELRAIAGECDSAAGYFPAMYAQVTTAMGQGCADGTFREPARLAAFAETFADFYLEARHSLRPPMCWASAWEVTDDDSLLIVQHLLLGINAHVNHDLPQVVVGLADQVGDLAALRRDFDVVNDVLAEVYNSISRCLDGVARWTSAALSLGGGRVFNFSLRLARQRAWTAAENMFPLNAEGRQAYVQDLDELVSVLAYLIAQHRFPRSLVVPVLRRFEDRDPRKVTAALLNCG